MIFNYLNIITITKKTRKVYPLGIYCNTWGAFVRQTTVLSIKQAEIYISKRFVGGTPKLPKGTLNPISKSPASGGGSNLSKLFSGSSAASNSNNAQASSSNNNTSPGSNETADKNIATSSQASLGPLKEGFDSTAEKIKSVLESKHISHGTSVKNPLSDSVPQTQTRVSTPLDFNHQDTRNMAYYTGGNPDLNNNDPQAKNNNYYVTKAGKVKLHREIWRDLCTFPGCIGKICKGFCGLAKGTKKAIAHVTHGQSLPQETDKKTVLLSGTDFNGDPEQQNAVFYDKPHDAGGTENAKITMRIKNDAGIQAAIKNNEN